MSDYADAAFSTVDKTHLARPASAKAACVLAESF